MTFKKSNSSESLDEFLKKKISPKFTQNDFLRTSDGERILNVVKQERIAEPLLLSVYMQIIKQGLLDKGLIDFSTEVLIAPVGENNYALLLIGSNLDPLSSMTIKQVLNPADVEKSYFSWVRRLQRHKAKARNFYTICCESYGLNDIANAIDSNFAVKYINEFDLSIVTLERPEYSYTNCDTAKAFLEISTDGVTRLGAGGVLAEDSEGRFGATLAYHTVSSHLAAGNRDVFINQYPASIISESQITDSCFAVFNDQTSARADLMAMTQPNKGPWRGKVPGLCQSATFSGTASAGQKKTIIRAWDPEIPFDFDDTQLKLITDADVNSEDLGTTLIDDEGCIMGFALHDINSKHNPSFRTWIWAESVFKVHNLIRSKSRSY